MPRSGACGLIPGAAPPHPRRPADASALDHDVITGTAIENVETGPADQHVISRASEQRVVPGTSDQDVAPVAAIRDERDPPGEPGPQDDVIAGQPVDYESVETGLEAHDVYLSGQPQNADPTIAA